MNTDMSSASLYVSPFLPPTSTCLPGAATDLLAAWHSILVALFISSLLSSPSFQPLQHLHPRRPPSPPHRICRLRFCNRSARLVIVGSSSHTCSGMGLAQREICF